MSGTYLTDLATVLRAAGLPVDEYPGWESRARSSGGFAAGRPWCVMWHHTASSTDPANDASYCAEGSSDAPICNIIVNRDGSVSVIAAGATNTNGKGQALQFSRGVVPADSMNTYAVGMEIANGGTGEPYPQVQIDAAFTASLAITSWLGLQPDDVAEHWDYAPDRKIDPATAAAVQGPWRPTSVTSSGTWAVYDLAGELWERAGAIPPDPGPPDPGPDPGPPDPPDPGPPLPPDEDDMRLTAAADDNGTIWIGDGIKRFPVPSMEVLSNYVILSNAGCYTLVDANGTQVRDPGHVFGVGGDTIQALGQA